MRALQQHLDRRARPRLIRPTWSGRSDDFASGTTSVDGDEITFTLDGASPSTEAFSDRPKREATTVETGEFANTWATRFGDDPPNAALIVDVDGTEETVLLTLDAPDLDTETSAVTYTARLLPVTNAESLASRDATITDADSLPATFGLAALFIDGAALDQVNLRLVNQSDAENTVRIAVYQKPTHDPTLLPVAWRVVDNLGPSDSQPFTYCPTVDVSATDAYGSDMNRLSALAGQRVEVTRQSQGDTLVAAGSSSDPDAVEIANTLTRGSVDANIYRCGNLLAAKTGLAPGQKTSFATSDSLWVGVFDDVEPGQVLNSAVTDAADAQELDLDNVASADIVMTGGGSGPDAPPFQFALDNITKVNPKK